MSARLGVWRKRQVTSRQTSLSADGVLAGLVLPVFRLAADVRAEGLDLLSDLVLVLVVMFAAIATARFSHTASPVTRKAGSAASLCLAPPIHARADRRAGL